MFESTLSRILIAVSVAGAAHLTTVLLRSFTRRILSTRFRSKTKLHTLTGFGTSVFVFAIYFAAFGFLLAELGISLTTYLASASVIGLAVSFGSQGIVQDVITGLTVVFSDLIDIGDMVEVSGQVGFVESVGMRFTVLVNFAGARVYIPNRSIANVLNYPSRSANAYLDARLPTDPALHEEALGRLDSLALAAYEQYPGILLQAPIVRPQIPADPDAPALSNTYARIQFRIWPGQQAILETAVKPEIVQAMRNLDPEYKDWMATLHYRSSKVGRRPEPLTADQKEKPS